ncbi:MAG: ATP synthase subunit [Bacillota bacterium]|nr:MAG: ATP synthase subunit [Bacillota bacterium]
MRAPCPRLAHALPTPKGGPTVTDNDRPSPVEKEREEFHREVERKEERARKAREAGDRTLQYGLGVFGVVGWSIVVPTLIGVAVGAWLDARTGGGIRYTLSLMSAGLILGLVNVWNWMQKR